MAAGFLKRLAFRLGYDFTFRKLPQYDCRRRRLAVPRDMEPEFVALYERVGAFTMTSVECLYALYRAVRYVHERRIPGDFVECGVWRGGSAMMMALALREAGDHARRIYLYDTFKGMTRPETVDVRARDGAEQLSRWRAFERGGHNEWTYAPLEEVRRNMASTGYPEERIVFVEGDVAETLPAMVPERIALLRLDTDWYRSTYHELQHLHPRLAPKGVLIIDDYGAYEGARKATDRYLADCSGPTFLARIDSAARIAIKP